MKTYRILFLILLGIMLPLNSLPAQNEGGGAIDATAKKIEALGERAEVRGASDRILEWIGAVEAIYRPGIHWFLVAIGIALFISHAGQFFVGKVWLAMRFGTWNWHETLNDLAVAVFAGLALPAILVIPVERGAFISNPIAVLSSVGAGMLFGIILYGHGLKQEAMAGEERKDRKQAKQAAEDSDLDLG